MTPTNDRTQLAGRWAVVRRSVRTFLVGLTVAGLASVAAACGDDKADAPASSVASPTRSQGQAATPSAAATKPGATATSSKSPAAAGATAELNDWAVKFCAASEVFDQAIKAVPSPKGKSVDEQKAMAPDVVGRISKAVDEAVAAISRLDPPAAGRQYQENNVAHLKTIKEIEVSVGAAIGRAKTKADVDAAGADERSRMSKNDEEFDRENRSTPAEVSAALKAVKKCGQVHS